MNDLRRFVGGSSCDLGGNLLGVDCDKPPPPLPVTVRQSAAPLRQGVTNYEELREAFKHHPLLRRCFEEEETDGEEMF